MRRRSGHSIVEFSLLLPWIVFLFVGAFDAASFGYALICTENAARVAVFYTSSKSDTASDASGACRYALPELSSLSNLQNVRSCSSLPVIVTATSTTGLDGNPASQVSVSYQTNQFIPIPGLLQGQWTFTRSVLMRIKP